MLQVIEGIPEGLLDLEEGELHRLLPGPTLIHLPGRRTPPLFVSVLLHGDEDSGWRALRDILRTRADGDLPRALSILIGNPVAAAEGKRYLPGQPDYNRIWTGQPAADPSPEALMARQVVEEMTRKGVFASIDIHNNTGINPHYACVRGLDYRSLHLAVLFGRTVVYARRPPHVLADAFAPLGPAVIIECGQRGVARGAAHAGEYLDACLHLSEIPDYPVAEHDLDLFHTVAVARVRPGVSFSFGAGEEEVRFRSDLDHQNFRELAAGTDLGKIRRPLEETLSVLDEEGREVPERYFTTREGRLLTATAFMPSMFTVDVEAVRLDCLGYLMERISSRQCEV